MVVLLLVFQETSIWFSIVGYILTFLLKDGYLLSLQSSSDRESILAILRLLGDLLSVGE